MSRVGLLRRLGRLEQASGSRRVIVANLYDGETDDQALAIERPGFVQGANDLVVLINNFGLTRPGASEGAS